jgi:holo-[acyl-carrier protein] synthase
MRKRDTPNSSLGHESPPRKRIPQDNRAETTNAEFVIVKVGLDLVAVERFVFSEARAKWYARRIFTETEIAYAASKRNPQQHLAGAFAVKEAFRKAVGGSVPWREIGVTHEASGAPALALGHNAQAKLASLGDVVVHVSITHTSDNAAATIIIERIFV